MTRVEHRSKKTGGMDNWCTPPLLVDWLRQRGIRIVCDLAASKDNAVCDVFIDEETDALRQNWCDYISIGTAGFCNPPYSLSSKFLDYAHRQGSEGADSIFLVAARPGTEYWHKYVHGVAKVQFLTGRIKFVSASHPAPFESALLYYGRVGYWELPSYSAVKLPKECMGYV